VISYRAKAQFDQPATILLATEEQIKGKGLLLKQELAPLIQSKQFSAEFEQLFPLFIKKKLILLVGIGKKNQTLTNVRIAVKNALGSSYLKKIDACELIAYNQDEATLRAVVEGVLLGGYVWNKYKSEAKANKKKVILVTDQKKICDETAVICEATNFARNLINENAGIANSAFLEATIKGLVRGKKNISLEILKEKEMKAKGLGLHLAVNRGSENEPRLVIVKYAGAGTKAPYTALIGKGMTYDTGGLNLKPTGSIETMRIDMSGTAAVIGTLKAALDLKIKKNILFVCAIAENAIDAKSYRPGDVFKGYSGKTVEIGNTDAEGRLVLADAISYTARNYKPKRLIDIATLTGACVVALGHEYTGLCTNDDSFSRDIVHSSNATDDRVWRLPIFPELKDHVKSKIADIRNIGLKGAAGTISAAEFLRQFTENTPWVHLDIAGTAFVDGDNRWYFNHGGTGAGVRLLTHYLQNYA